MIGSFDLDKTYQYLLIILAFLMPLTVAGANFVVVLIVLLWFFSGNYKFKVLAILSNKLMIASILFYLIHVLGMLWTEDIIWGLEILHKMWYFLLFFPILFTIVKKDYIIFYLSAFTLAIGLTELVSYLIWFEIISPFKNASLINPTPFMTHVSYNPILTIAIYIVMHQVLFNNDLSRLKFLSYSFFALSMTINMFITGGRAGQIMYFAMLAIIIFQYFNTSKIKSIIAVLVFIPSIFFVAYESSSIFHNRVNDAVKDVITYEKNSNASVAKRITFAINSWEIIKNNPLIGVGTGDLPNEYQKVNEKNKSRTINATNTHNMYTLVLIQNGLLGLIGLLSIFYYQIKLSLNSPNKFIRDLGISLPLLYLLVMWSDSYLLGHYTTLVFVFFSSFLYKDFEKN